jgi:hypothetical protein
MHAGLSTLAPAATDHSKPYVYMAKDPGVGPRDAGCARVTQCRNSPVVTDHPAHAGELEALNEAVHSETTKSV